MDDRVKVERYWSLALIGSISGSTLRWLTGHTQWLTAIFTNGTSFFGSQIPASVWRSLNVAIASRA